MSIDYTILGVLIESPTHGYSIKKYLAENVSKDFGINDGQLYPALARLEERGWIRKRVIPQRRSPTKHQYSATPEGERAFFRWLEDLDAECEPSGPRYDFYWKHGFLQRLAFFRYLPAGRVRAQVERRLEEASRRLADLEEVCAQLGAQGVEPYRRAVADYGVRYQRMRREWLESLLALSASEAEETPDDVRERAGEEAGGEGAPAVVSATATGGSEERAHVRFG